MAQHGHLLSLLKPGRPSSACCRTESWIRNLHLFDPAKQGTATTYMNDCRPTACPFRPTGPTARRGHTDADPAVVCGVWRPLQRPRHQSACVALPERRRSRIASAGIICQSASTGHAYYRRPLRGSARPTCWAWPAPRHRRSRQRCETWPTPRHHRFHRGNNVYLLSPDDPTWPSRRSWEAHDARGDVFRQSRHAPATSRSATLPERPGWVNAFTTGGTAGPATSHRRSRGRPPCRPHAHRRRRRLQLLRNAVGH